MEEYERKIILKAKTRKEIDSIFEKQGIDMSYRDIYLKDIIKKDGFYNTIKYDYFLILKNNYTVKDALEDYELICKLIIEKNTRVIPKMSFERESYFKNKIGWWTDKEKLEWDESHPGFGSDAAEIKFSKISYYKSLRKIIKNKKRKNVQNSGVYVK